MLKLTFKKNKDLHLAIKNNDIEKIKWLIDENKVDLTKKVTLA
jgi:hypothetical protein